ncbi:DNA-binding response regulator, OmpR family, contains REC and winged-helix (wHTH) domain [Chitinophaga jiangningensis]|uniref:DNA-binding response regulator, OmpR family, contains REC and winged-helix (WHTH) domain n=1 Tax=Chitinophaga jiangningensis TaxID=1419482 RepID=A0A1M6YTQ2_9BACT|nr:MULTISPECIES: response regulator transcription factor [Chitinophaga]MBV7529247.1 response regulator transcription factor [Chitinophaga sp. sic0106]SHL21587.1 DNA-binding response regulator, OmpR family, contains REC and winged-helix (wHTH) domain [Chitinophaga jiangningensis]
MKVLIVEDNKELSSGIADYLTGEKYICEPAYDFETATEKLSLFSYDCILVDIMLPDGNGLELLKQIRQENIRSGILIISAKDALDDKVKGLDEGADDYVIKPFHMSELHARLRAIYRRKQLEGPSSQVVFNEIELNTDTIEASVNNQPLDVTRKEFDLLLYFIVNKNRVLSKQAIAAHLWGDYTDNLSNFDFVYQHVKNLRKKISVAEGTDYIETVYGLGYKFNTSKQ